MTDRPTPLQRLDDSVRWTGIPALAEGKQRRRPLRWSSALAVAVASIGLVWQLAEPGFASASFVLLMIGFAVACFLPVLGPIKPWTESIGDRERVSRARAFLFTYACIAVIAMAGLWTLLALASVRGWDMTELRAAMTTLAFYLMTLHSAGPTLYASWARRRD